MDKDALAAEIRVFGAQIISAAPENLAVALGGAASALVALAKAAGVSTAAIVAAVETLAGVPAASVAQPEVH